MDAVPEVRRYSSRWGDAPIVDKDGREQVATLTINDIPIFKLLCRYRYLRADFIAELLDRSLPSVIQRLNQLTRPPNKYLRRPEAQRSQPNADYRRLIYELAPRGERTLRDLGHWKEMVRIGDEVQFAHAMMINDALANIDLGVRRNRRARLIPWEEIVSSSKFPAVSKEASHPPHTIPVSIDYRFGDGRTRYARFNYTNDCHGPFGVMYKSDRPSFRFFSYEAEHKNSLDRTNLDQPSFLKKVLAILVIQQKGLYRTYWGLPNLFHLFGIPTGVRIEHMREIVLRETQGRGSPNILFREVSALGDPFKVSKPTPAFFGPWDRAGFPPLDISKERAAS